MTKKDDITPATPPSEFTAFVRRIGINAFDRFAQRKVEGRALAAASRSPRPLHKLASLWLEMSDTEKTRFFDQLIAAGQTAVAAAPAMIAMAKTRKGHKSDEAMDSSEMNTPTPPERKKKKKDEKKATKKRKDKKEKGEDGDESGRKQSEQKAKKAERKKGSKSE